MITCREATTWLLEADLSELESPPGHAVAGHVAACCGCAARAARIVGDTAWLAHAVHAARDDASEPSRAIRGVGRPARRWTHVFPVAAVLLAASIIALVLTRTPGTMEQDASIAGRTGIASSSIVPAPSVAISQPDTRSRGVEAPATIHHRTQQQSSGDRHETVVAVAPIAIGPEAVPAIATREVRLDTLHDRDSSAVEARPSLAVDVVPSTGRYAVLGSTPKVTVVWFY